MIILRRGGCLLLLRQLDHAALAGRFAEEWGNLEFEAPSPRDSVVLAAARHDEGWREPDDGLRYDSERKAPLYFLDGSIENYVALYAGGIHRIADLDPYAGLLVSMHGTGNICGRWGLQPGLRLSAYDAQTWPPIIERFVLEQEALQSRLKLAILGISPTERRSLFERRLWSNWELMQSWDRLSLFLCRTDPEQAAEAELGVVPTSLEGTDSRALAVRAHRGGVAAIEPWPFRADSLAVEVPYVEVADRPYASAEEVAAAVAGGRRRALRWRLQAAQ